MPGAEAVSHVDAVGVILADPKLDGTIDVVIRKRILDGIGCSGMFDRQDRISAAFPDTFSWLFAEDPSNSPMGFKGWLSSPVDNAPFWITGKPASGKRTFMKFIVTHPNLQAMLERWSGRRKVLSAKVSFWGPGSPLQKFQGGLLRSLLFQLLRQRPDLCSTIVPRRYLFYMMTNYSHNLDLDMEWEVPELRAVLERFAAQVDGADCSALFIDGLEEYGGNQTELVTFLVELQKTHHLKLCISSRPWNVFADAFRANPSLRMEDLTKNDIHRSVNAHLQESAGFEELRRLYPVQINKLIHDIETKAQGVFLCVVLAVQELLIEVQDNPRLEAVRKTFNSLPQDLESLYNAIQKGLSNSQRENASKLYQLTYEWKRLCGPTVDPTTLWVAFEFDDVTDFDCPLETKRSDDIPPILSRLLVGSTRGLLQVYRHLSYY